MKKYFPRQIPETAKTVIAALSVLTLAASCQDWFDIKPETELVSDDFWQSKSDVESSVAACYRSLMEPEAMERLIVWSEVRSDNVVAGTSTNTDMSYLLSANVNASNSYTSWGSIYTTINYCNTVIENAPAVAEKDPDFKQTELRAYLAEAMTLRALCYFYLVRTFGDVPFVTEPYTDDTRDFMVGQTDGDAVVDSLLSGLEGIAASAKSVYSTTAYTKGRITQKAVWALMADMYLWRGDYDGCIECCEKITDSSTNALTLESSSLYNRSLFGTGNSQESIFELQFSSDTPDYVVNEMYGTTGGRNYYNHLSAYDFYHNTSLFPSTDLRMKDAFWGEASTAVIPIEKYVAYRKEGSSSTTVASDYVTNENTQNWIFYRLPDAYLMEAEALVERGGAGDWERAVELVSKTYDRANPSLGAGTLQLSDYNSLSSLRDLVMDERQREFLFEGKRYYDLLRRIRREGNLQGIVSAYLLRKYTGQDQTTVMTKLNTLNALYLPVNADELNTNTLLVQNPFYQTSEDIAKN